MRGYPGFNFEAFDVAAKHARHLGWSVVSPADLDREAKMQLPKNGILDEEEERACIRRDCLAIIDLCKAVAVLEGWQHSKGARVEVALAEFLRMPVYPIFCLPHHAST